MTRTPAAPTSAAPRPAHRNPIAGGGKKPWTQFAVYLFILVPFAALVAAVPLAWGWGLTWLDVGLAIFFFYLSRLGVALGYHRAFTHRAVQGEGPPAELPAIR